MPAVGHTELLLIAEKLRQKISSELRSAGEIVTVSLGAAELHAEEGWQDWLRRADAALYAAKSAGRNRTVLG
jgi:diguanylate cyclase (GGDEF)-like protein